MTNAPRHASDDDADGSPPSPGDASRREFLSGRAFRKAAEAAGGALADELQQADQIPRPPVARDTVRLATDAMACEFAVILNRAGDASLAAASSALDLIHVLEDRLSVYRPHSDLSRLNDQAAAGPVAVEAGVFELLEQSALLARQTEGAFDPTSGPLIALWRECRAAGRVPDQSEIDACLAQTGIDHVTFDSSSQTVQFTHPGVAVNAGGIGKGYALDRAGEQLQAEGIADWLFHGGHSSLLASGAHTGADGWPVGIRNPLFPDRPLATVLLTDEALSSSGLGTQHFRLGGKRFGHILDPRTGWPVDGMLSVTVLAPTAALADALSTAFFVLGLEKARQWCDNRTDVSALLIPPPARGQTLHPVVCGIPRHRLFFAEGVEPAT